VLSAAQILADVLASNSSNFNIQPDPSTADIINTWLENCLPVRLILFIYNSKIQQQMATLNRVNRIIKKGFSFLIDLFPGTKGLKSDPTTCTLYSNET
jgi:hypothetical protein